MTDPQVERYARLLVERCVGVEPGWQVIVESTPLARPLVDEVVRVIARRGAYALVRMTYPATTYLWIKEAPEEVVGELPPIEQYVAEHVDGYVIISAPENVRDGSDVSPERLALRRKALQPATRRRLNKEVPWVGCQFPTPALAQEAGMTLEQFEEFLFGACLLDWDEVAARMRRYADRFDAADEVRILGEGTDIRIGLAGRRAEVDDGHLNMPGGEFFFSPVEDATEGMITFSEFPAVYMGHEVKGARLVFERGRVVDASAESGEEFLIKTLESDEGARVLGELGIGCNPGIQRHTKNTLFDEKIYGTAHLAVGAAFPFIGGRNVSNVHWDLVKDLRRGGQITLDGELVQENGEWLI